MLPARPQWQMTSGQVGRQVGRGKYLAWSVSQNPLDLVDTG